MMTGADQASSAGQVVSVNGIELYYEVYGEGTPLLLLHGFTQSSQFWHPFIPDFGQHFQLIVPDFRGHGRSTNPVNEITHRQLALDIYALMDTLEIDRFKAMGVSSGGMALLHMTTQQPARVESMVLIGSCHYYTDQARAIQRETTTAGEGRDWEGLRKRHVYGDDQIRALFAQFHSFSDSYDDMNFTTPYLSTIRAKTLIVHGDRDQFFPVSTAVEMYTSIPNSYLWIVPNGGHVPIVEDRASPFIQTALAFLQGEWEQ